ncbi:wee1-like protein kinase [Leptidea sinapis]|uniref:wee1-like protein kinase n=1 Tax=Leptidea sinapis TaxID=189913 RepID=UPI00211FA5EF|nr:wee1-like protein kinase [Leptidea sinapis]
MSEWYRMKTGHKHDNSSDLSVETSCEMSDSFNNMFSDNLSPIPTVIVPRKLDFSNMDDNDCTPPSASPAPAPLSPPYKKVRALRLFDSPHTPKSLLQKCSTPSHHPPRSRLFPPKLNIPSGLPSGSSHHLHPPSDEDSALGSLALDDLEDSRYNRRPLANINPFTPNGQALNKKKRALSKTPTSQGNISPQQPAKRLRESNISRYNVEFVELDVIGCGQFGRVARCVNKLDGCVYALKRSLRPVAGSAEERAALTEVYAHAALGVHPHVVRYYSAWAEDDHMIIQNEFCDGGSLQQLLESGPLPENELLLLLAHISDGLAYMHSLQLVHMDVKPGNIFICNEEVASNSESDDGYDDEDEVTTKPKHKYKIGDLGHVTCVSSPSVDDEGDCRYLSKEILHEEYTDLTKADIFAFGLTLFEAGGGGPLPKNGQEWHDLRDGKLPDLPNISREFNQLLKDMVQPNPRSRPSAARIRRHPLLHKASKAQLRRELAAARLNNELLTNKLREAARCIKSLTPNPILNQESAKFRTRSAKRLQKPRVDSKLVEMIKSVTSPIRIDRQIDRLGNKEMLK